MKDKNDNMDKAIIRAINLVKGCGLEIIDNADRIVGGYDLQTGDLIITITISESGAPDIAVETHLLPKCLL